MKPGELSGFVLLIVAFRLCVGQWLFRGRVYFVE